MPQNNSNVSAFCFSIQVCAGAEDVNLHGHSGCHHDIVIIILYMYSAASLTQRKFAAVFQKVDNANPFYFSELFSVRRIFCLSWQVGNEPQKYSSVWNDKLNLVKLLVLYVFFTLHISNCKSVNFYVSFECEYVMTQKWSLLFMVINFPEIQKLVIAFQSGCHEMSPMFWESLSCHCIWLGHVNLATLKLWIYTFLEECVHKWVNDKVEAVQNVVIAWSQYCKVICEAVGASHIILIVQTT
jgi:hypothetical protein